MNTDATGEAPPEALQAATPAAAGDQPGAVQRALGIIGKLLLAVAGALTGLVVGLIIGLATGLIDIQLC